MGCGCSLDRRKVLPDADSGDDESRANSRELPHTSRGTQLSDDYNQSGARPPTNSSHERTSLQANVPHLSVTPSNFDRSTRRQSAAQIRLAEISKSRYSNPTITTSSDQLALSLPVDLTVRDGHLTVTVPENNRRRMSISSGATSLSQVREFATMINNEDMLDSNIMSLASQSRNSQASISTSTHPTPPRLNTPPISSYVEGSLPGHSGKVRSVSLSADARSYVSVGTGEQVIYRRDAETGDKLVSFGGHVSPVLVAVISPSLNLLLTTTDERRVWLWDLHSSRFVDTRVTRGLVTAAAFSADSSACCFGGHTGKTMVVRLHPRKGFLNRGCMLAGHTNVISAVRFGGSDASRDAVVLLLTSSFDCTVRLWAWRAQVLCLRVFSMAEPVLSCAFLSPHLTHATENVAIHTSAISRGDTTGSGPISLRDISIVATCRARTDVWDVESERIIHTYFPASLTDGYRRPVQPLSRLGGSVYFRQEQLPAQPEDQEPVRPLGPFSMPAANSDLAMWSCMRVFGPYRPLIALGCNDSTVRIYDYATHTCVLTVMTKVVPTCISSGFLENTLLIGDLNGNVQTVTIVQHPIRNMTEGGEGSEPATPARHNGGGGGAGRA